MEHTKEIGEIMVYGDWDDVTDNQFLVVWGEAGQTCTVVLLSGYDYGGGVTIGSSNVPVKELEQLIHSSENPRSLKMDVESLVRLYS